ncbi:MAG: cadmium-translocating P-type ATPase [Chromatiales bacterium]|nr:MAG: cadmium-translocating P-type ATPase [Chromatiales bacterium]
MSASGCFHCGQPLPVEAVTVRVDDEDRLVCSEDCARTAALIDARGLTEFYRFRTGPTAAGEATEVAAGRWQAYDRRALQREFVSTDADGSQRAQLLVQGVRCAACSWLIENALGALPGMRSVRVDPVSTRATLHWNPAQLQLSEVLAQLAHLGYTPIPYTEDAGDRAARLEQRAALKRLIVAGLGMMQVMSFAVALYFGAWRDPQIESFLRLISLLVATPVVFYAGAPFFRGAWHRLRVRALGMDVPVALAVGGAWAASVWNTLTGAGEVYFDSATMFVFFLSAARYLEMTGRHRALSLTGALAHHLPRVATRLVNGQPQAVGTMELQAGDRVLVAPGAVVPADGVLASDSARLDESLLTGESLAIRRQRGEPVVAGSLNQEQGLELVVTRVGADTVMAQITRLVGDAGARKPRLVELADGIASWFVAAVLLLAAVVGYAWWQWQPDRAFEVVLAVLVVTCPCALALATPAAFTVATAALARRGFMVRHRGALQSLSRVSDIVFDKTGTLTDGASGVSAVEPAGQVSADDALAIAAALESRSEHPLARAFPPPDPALAVDAVNAVPSAGLEGRVNGRCYRIGTRTFAAAPGGDPAAQEQFPAAPDRVVYLGDQDGLIARITVDERPRQGAAGVLTELAARGLRLHIFSGDQPGPVEAMARQLGMEHWRATLRPEDKLAAAAQLQADGRVVAMVGDGINDSPVLAGADVSVAMGEGTSLAQHSADCVLMSDSLEPLATAVHVARRTMRVVRQNLVWAVVYNLVALPLAAAGALAPWMAAIGMSASSLLVTGNALRLTRAAAPRRRMVQVDRPPTAESAPAKACCKGTARAAS